MIVANGFPSAPRTGDRAPFTFGMTRDKAFYSFDSQAGRAAVVLLVGSSPPAIAAPFVAAFDALAPEFARRETDVIVLIDAHGPFVLDHAEAPASHARTVFCLPRIFREWGFGAAAEPQVHVIDRNARVITAIAPHDPDATAGAVLACLPSCKDSAECPAPILVIPNIFTAGFCRDLMDHFESNPHIVGGMASMDAEGNAYHKVDAAKKKREDFVLGPEDRFHDSVVETLSRTCAPEIKRAFQFEASHTDRILIARYDDDGGCFLRHRDNAAPGVAFRQFALSINLNTEDYEGGHLLFPEYNSHCFKPARGAGVVFSASLLHEAAPVLKGSRYVLLTFLHNAEGEARRLAAA